MPLVETIVTIFSVSSKAASSLKLLRDFLRSRAEVEKVLTKLVADGFEQRLPRLKHLCLNAEPSFDSDKFYLLLTSTQLNVRTVNELRQALIPLLSEAVSMPNLIFDEGDVLPVYESIIDSAMRGMWKKIGSYEAISNELLLIQGQSTLQEQQQLRENVHQDLAEVSTAVAGVDISLQDINQSIKALAEFAQAIPQQVFDKLTDTSPPAEHTIGSHTYVNPFLLVRAEDFNHNYDKLARLFQQSPEWDAIQSRTENVFIEGGRGSGKSMLLRRLTAQATVAAKRVTLQNATFDDVTEDYFGVYVKLTRGYYEQFKPTDTVNPHAAALLAQQELNIEIFDAFIDTVDWLINNRALANITPPLDPLIKDLSAMLSGPTDIQILSDLKKRVVRKEQDQIY